MRYRALPVLAMFFLFCAAYADQARAADAFSLRSADFTSGHSMPLRYSYDRGGCSGQNISPQLRWSHVPPATKSFALAVFDPDARNGAGWWHWVMFDIPRGVRQLSPGAGQTSDARLGMQATSSFGTTGYGGPCPPPGDPSHHYVFTLYALNVVRLPGATTGMTGAQLLALLKGHEQGHAQLTGRFGRRM
ncbi:MAG: YbhB/YbcL family Raf kinase inhibitor-like protein [Candidatus Eremiobacteraeota bacterium]|nr:YbhB/YbcL family Raf kinase inhibitor-like protein [Candidatus Eremiobacteraeota bacterium]MBC5828209.1 YbhB/YbcL family Raf kinase inhibitor-like protein [Candidatus Eremiobacteraeota bacterium]